MTETRKLGVGERVRGTYYGSKFTGVVTLSRFHTLHPTRVEVTVKLDVPVFAFGNPNDPREYINVAQFDANEINKVEAI